MLSVGARGGVAARGGVGALGGVGARGGVAAWGGVGALGCVAAREDVGTLGGVGARDGVCALYRRISGVSSSSSLSSVKPTTTLRHFWLLSSSLIFKRPPVPRGPVDFFFWEGPSDVRHFQATFLVT